MGSKWHYKLFPAERRMLRRIELDPEYRPPTKDDRARDRFWKLVDAGFIVIDPDTEHATVRPKGPTRK